jgi:NitT/TauT family transport system substrate-binding protein
MNRTSPAKSVMVALSVALLSTMLLVAGCGSSSPGSSTATVQSTLPSAASTTSTSAPAPSSTGTSTTSTSATSVQPGTTGSAKLAKLVLVAPPGPMAIPAAYLVANDKLASVADKTELVIWENPDQLKAIVAGKQGDFVTMPSNNAAIFYNKGLPLKLLDISVWNITYLVSSDANAKTLADLKGQSIVISFQGSVPDLMFQYLAKKQGLDPQKDFQIKYASDPTQAAQLLLAGQAQNAVLSEPLATSVLLKTKDGPKHYYRTLDFAQEWAKAVGPNELTPIAGTVATAGVMDNQTVVSEFLTEYKQAVDWMLANPAAAGLLLEKQLPQLGFKAAPMTASLKNIAWKFTPAAQARPDMEKFLSALSTLSPAVIGGKLPDAGFYYQPIGNE